MLSLRVEEDTKKKLLDFCSSKNTTPSDFLRDLIDSIISEDEILYSAGINQLKYDPRADKFKWILLFDNGDDRTLSDNITINFLDNLDEEITRIKKVRSDHIGKQKKESVLIPSNLINKKINGNKL